MDTPLVLMDIDGVVNAFGAKHPIPAHQRFARAGRYTVVLDERHPEWMLEMEARAEMCWATMWQYNAATQFAPVAGFGEDWEYIDFDSFHGTLGARTGNGVVNHKWPGILASVGEDQPLVYVDDDMRPDHHRWAALRNEAGIPTLFIQPDPEHGLTRAQYERIIDFLDAVYIMDDEVLATV